MRLLLASAFTALFISFTAQAGVIRGVLLNDDDPYIIKGADGSIYKPEWYWGSTLFNEGDVVILSTDYGRGKMICPDSDEVADVWVDQVDD